THFQQKLATPKTCNRPILNTKPIPIWWNPGCSDRRPAAAAELPDQPRPANPCPPWAQGLTGGPRVGENISALDPIPKAYSPMTRVFRSGGPRRARNSLQLLEHE